MLPFGSVANVWSGGNFWLSGNKHKQVTLLSVPLIKHEHHCNCSEGRGGLILSFCDVCIQDKNTQFLLVLHVTKAPHPDILGTESGIIDPLV